jgi:hypothetical protein
MKTRKRLPIGLQTLTNLIEDGCYYVDKTPFALRLIEQGSYFFLSRPRRFGKSLFLDTLKELFEGNEALFKGLYAETHWNWQVKYPVIKISFGAGVLKNRAELDERIAATLENNQNRLRLSCKRSGALCFEELIHAAHEQAGQRVVVLVDEYDKPMLDNLLDPAIARDMRDGLRNFYSVIKDNDAHVKFVFITGVSKFSKVSLFSGLNNLEDITISPEYSAICGYTEADVDAVFAAELEGLDREEMRRWYNGYNWTGESVYNPFDLLLLFRNRHFRPWWFESGTPTFLIDLIAQRHQFIPSLEQGFAAESLLSTFDVDDIPTEALMFQAGYLTLAAQEHISGEYFYHLRYPNREVYQSLNASLLRAWTAAGSAEARNRVALIRLLEANNLAGLQALITAFFSSIPHDWYRKNPIAQYEGYYASVFYAYFASLGLDITLEDTSNHGRLDMALRFNGHIYLFEFKVVEFVPEGTAMEQLKKKDYAAKYRALGEPIHQIGIEFSKESRNIVAFEVETIE